MDKNHNKTFDFVNKELSVLDKYDTACSDFAQSPFYEKQQRFNELAKAKCSKEF